MIMRVVAFERAFVKILSASLGRSSRFVSNTFGRPNLNFSSGERRKKCIPVGWGVKNSIFLFLFSFKKKIEAL